MAKKQIEMTIEERLKALFKLQLALSGIDEKRALRGELPLEVRDLEDEIEGLNTRKEKIHTEIDEYQAAIAQKKGEIVVAQTTLDRYKKQIDDVRNNREFDTLTKEIEFQTLEIELCNKKIKEAQTRIEERQSDEEQIAQIINERTQDLLLKRAELNEIMQETREAEEVLKEQAHQIEIIIEPRLLSSYRRIRKSVRNGLGIVYVNRDACGGCFAKIPPQRQLDVKMHKKIIVCEYCGRILIDPELAGVKADGTADAKPKRKATSSTTKKATTATKKAAATNAKADDEKPAVKETPAKKTEEKKTAPVVEVSTPVVETPAAKKPAAEKPAAEKPAAEKPAAKKPAAKPAAMAVESPAPAAEKPAAEKPAAEKPAAKSTAAAKKPAAKSTAAAKKPTAKK